tara:strand:+ start:6767 stop:7426 length:660 start_codon:yes stop_codon:yes gene_type:complete
MASNKTFYIAQTWNFKKGNGWANDDMEILGIFQELGNAYELMNHRFQYYLGNRQKGLTRILFPSISIRKQREREYRKIWGKLVSDKIIKYQYNAYYNAMDYCQPIPGKEYDGETKVRLDLTLDSCYLQLMAFQKWISNQTMGAYFSEYSDIPLIINEEFRGLARKVSANCCRIYIYDHDNKQLFETLYLGENLIDFEDCKHREKHFCSSFRIYTKTLRD